MAEIASLLAINRKTCGRWIKNEGLKVMEENTKPVLVMGAALEDFIRKKRAGKKVPLEEDEFYCFRCHKAVKAKSGSEAVIKTGRMAKSGVEQVKKVGVCKACEKPLNKFLKLSQKN